METGEQVSLKFEGFDILHVSFTNLKIVAINENSEVQLTVRPVLHKFKSHSRFFKIVIEVSLKREVVFDLKVAGMGHFQLSEDVTEKEMEQMTQVNATAIIYPYMRAFITTITSNFGPNFIGLILPTQFFKGSLEEVIHETLTDPRDNLPEIKSES